MIASFSPETRRARERLTLDLRTLARDAEYLLHAAADDMGEQAREARERIKAAVERVKTTCGRLQAQGVESAREMANQGDRIVRSNPYQTLGIAFGLGLAVGWLIHRD